MSVNRENVRAGTNYETYTGNLIRVLEVRESETSKFFTCKGLGKYPINDGKVFVWTGADFRDAISHRVFRSDNESSVEPGITFDKDEQVLSIHLDESSARHFLQLWKEWKQLADVKNRADCVGSTNGFRSVENIRHGQAFGRVVGVLDHVMEVDKWEKVIDAENGE